MGSEDVGRGAVLDAEGEFGVADCALANNAERGGSGNGAVTFKKVQGELIGDFVVLAKRAAPESGEIVVGLEGESGESGERNCGGDAAVRRQREEGDLLDIVPEAGGIDRFADQLAAVVSAVDGVREE